MKAQKKEYPCGTCDGTSELPSQHALAAGYMDYEKCYWCGGRGWVPARDETGRFTS